MKHLVSCILILTMLTGTTVAFADLQAGDEYKDGIVDIKQESTAYKELTGRVYYDDINDYSKVGILGALGIVTGKENSSFKPEEKVSRAEFFGSLLKMIRIDPSLSDGISSKTGKFYDVDNNSQYYSIVYNALSAGITSGYSDNSFKPEQNITYEEALRATLRSLGYEGNGQEFLKIAYEIKLTKSISVSLSEQINRFDMAKLIYNAINAPTKQRSYKTEETYTHTGECILKSKWGVTSDTGIVSGSFVESICELTASRQSVIINNRRLYTEDEANNFLIGYDVKYWYDEDDNLIYMLKSNKVSEIIIPSEEYVDFDETTGTLTYEENGTAKKQTLSGGFTLLYNGIRPRCNYDKSIFDIADGKITLVSNDNGATYDIALIEEYRDYVVKSISTEGAKCKIAINNGVFNFDLSSTYMKIFNSDGRPEQVYKTTAKGEEVIDVSAIKSDNVISIYTEYGGYDNGMPKENTPFVKIHVSKSTVEGTVTAYNPEEQTVKIEDKEYRIACYRDDNGIYKYIKTENISQGTEAKFYLDSSNKIVDIAGGISKSEWNYGYLVKVYYNPDDELIEKIIIFNTNEEMETDTIPEKLNINGKKIKHRNVISTLMDSGRLVGRSFDNGDGLKPIEISQVIKYKKDDGVVTDIQTIVKEIGQSSEYSEEHLRRDASTAEIGKTLNRASDTTILYYSDDENRVGRYYPPAIVFKVPTFETADPKYYSIAPIVRGSSNVDLDFYDMDKLKARIGVWYQNSAESKAINTGYNTNGTFVVMFHSKSMSVDEDNNPVIKFKVARAGAISEYIVEQENFNILDGIKKGDLIRIYGQDSAKIVDSIVPCTYNGKNIGPDNLPWDCIKNGTRVNFKCGNWENGDGVDMFAMECLSNVGANYAQLQYGDLISSYERNGKAICYDEGDAWSMGGILIYDETDGKPRISAGSYENLKGADKYGIDQCSIVLYFLNSGSARETIIYNLESNNNAKLR